MEDDTKHNYGVNMTTIISRAFAHAMSIVKLVTTFAKINLAKIVKGKQTTQHSFTPVEYIALRELFTDQKYQRLINQSFIKKAKVFNPKLARPLVLARRPDGQLVIIDGQHTACLAAIYLEGDGEQVLPCQIVIEHPVGTSEEDCIKIESQFFDDLNYLRNNANAVARLRAAIAAGTQWAIDLEETFFNIGVHVEGIGDAEGHEIFGYAKLRTCLSKYGEDYTRQAVEHYAKIISKTKQKEWKKPLQAGLVLGLAAAFHFRATAWKTECVGKKEFTRFLNTYLTGTTRQKFSPKYWTEKTSGVVMDELILGKFITLYNSLESISGDRIDKLFATWKDNDIHSKSESSIDSADTQDNTLDNEE